MEYVANEAAESGSFEYAWIIWALIGGAILLSFGVSAFFKVRNYNRKHHFVSFDWDNGWTSETKDDYEE